MNLMRLLPLFNEDKELTTEVIETLVAQIKPILYAVLKEGFDMYKDLADNADYFTYRAKMKHELFKAYQDLGFSEDQAMLLLLNNDTARVNFAKQLLRATPIFSSQDA